MRTAVVIIAAAGVAVGLGGCRAEPRPPAYEMGGPVVDMGAGAGDLGCVIGPTEICDNGCDDDGNGYTDDDDPACTSQLLVTLALPAASMPTVDRLILRDNAPPQLVVLDGNPVQPRAMSAYEAKVSPQIYLVVEASKVLQRVTLDGGLFENALQPLANVRDVCIFNGEIIVIDPFVATDVPPGGRLHRFKPDASTEIMPWVPVEGHLSACTSDGNSLYVARYIAPNPSEIVVLTVGAGGTGLALSGTVYPMPPRALGDTTCCATTPNCCDRLVDFAWIAHTRSFVGLFAPGLAGTLTDKGIDTKYLAQFGLDGGVGPWLDAGMLHGVGKFAP